MNVPKTLWGEAVRHTIYILNHVPTKAVKNGTPYEGWKKRKPNLKNLKVFGCMGYATNVAGHVHKLDDRGIPMIYVGIEPGNKVRLFNPKTKKLVVARVGDVTLIESKQWSWKEEMSLTQKEKENSTWYYVKHDGGMSEHVGGDNQESGANFEGDPSTPTILNTNNLYTPIHDAGTSCKSPMQNSKDNSGSCEAFPTSYDDSPLQKFRSINDVYEETTALTNQEVKDMYEMEELLLLNDEPTSYKEASNEEVWMKAMLAELKSIEKNQTWTLTQLPPNQKAVGLKWVFKLKKDEHGNVTKHKARLVAKGYVQQKRD
ncbi:putative RNA-directed DNA polymerase [Helianthus annuus]|nr:putative RNA-directed DNA polymerase [Helianthus annuus]